MFEYLPFPAAAAVFTLIVTAGLWTMPQPVMASEPPAENIVAAIEADPADTPSPETPRSNAHPDDGARATAKASAKASASASAGGSKGQGCRAESSARSEASAGDEYAYDEDSDSDQTESSGCRAEARSSAKASAGRRKQEQ